MSTPFPLAQLEQRLGYVFLDQAQAWQALTHRSHSTRHNERLEFLGDGVLNLAAAAALYQRHPDWTEGELSRVRAALVNRDALLRLAQTLNLAPLLRLGEGELKGGGAQRPSILADAVEALFGAIFLEGGWSAAQPVIVRLLADIGLEESLPANGGKDAKTRLQEWAQGRRGSLPHYDLLETLGADHAPLFRVRCTLPERGVEGTGEGRSRREAEQQAALNILQQVENSG
ncbi:MAG: ribonuclease III [Ferrovum sp.]|nr:ribonuclease III [Ferrovum sp.]NDU87518.1 ribonuclease III [Ferrovum sp.]